jgi:hypothetical protein
MKSEWIARVDEDFALIDLGRKRRSTANKAELGLRIEDGKEKKNITRRKLPHLMKGRTDRHAARNPCQTLC